MALILDESKHAWTLDRLAEGLDALATRSGLRSRAIATAPLPRDVTPVQVGRWIESAAARMGIEAEPVDSTVPELRSLLAGAAPAVLALPRKASFLLLLKGSPSAVTRITLLGPDLAEHRLPLSVVADALTHELEAPVGKVVDDLLRGIGLSERRRARARSAMVAERLSGARVGRCWILRLPPGGSFWEQARRVRAPRYVFAFVAAHLAQYLLWVYAWWVIGEGALGGNLNWGWMVAWALLLVTIIPFRVAASWCQGLVAVGVGALLKQRLLLGALKLSPDEIRHQGTGHHLGRIIESEAVETLALTGGFLAIVSVLELVVVLFVLIAGIGGILHALLLCGWAALGGAMAWRYFLQRRRWTEARLQITHDLIERMVGHRTRIAQQSPERWHEGEDEALQHYFELGQAMDKTGAWLGILPRGWIVVGLAGLTPGFVWGQQSLPRLAVSFGGTLLALRSFDKLVAGLQFLVHAAIAWKQASFLFHAAARVEPSGDPSLALITPAAPSSETILEASEVSYRYPDRPEPVLRGLSLTLAKGDRALLESPSGGGKSTLVSLLNGVRSPDSGLLLLHGLDRQSFGAEAWTRRVATAPQFHENHVITETFGFNLLMGRGWPPTEEDLEEAEALCRKLGLGELLDRMPAGLLQMVGETGWQLSHGEKSRLYIARTLLQGAELILLDESFGALDPANLRQALECVLEHAPSLLVIAHP